MLAYLSAQLQFSFLACSNLVIVRIFVVLMCKHVMQRICCRSNLFVGGRVEVDLTVSKEKSAFEINVSTRCGKVRRIDAVCIQPMC